MNALEKYAKKRSLSDKLLAVSGGIAGGGAGAFGGAMGFAGGPFMASKLPDGETGFPKLRRMLPKALKRLIDNPKALGAIGAGAVVATGLAGMSGGAKAGKYLANKPKKSYGGTSGRLTAQAAGGLAGSVPGMFAGTAAGVVGAAPLALIPGRAGKWLSGLASLGLMAGGTIGGSVIGAAAGRKLVEKNASAWRKLAAGGPPKPKTPPLALAKSKGVPPPGAPVGKSAGNVKPIQNSLNTKGAMPMRSA